MLKYGYRVGQHFDLWLWLDTPPVPPGRRRIYKCFFFVSIIVRKNISKFVIYIDIKGK